MHKKILSLVLSLSLLQGASLSVLAADVSVKSDPFTATAPSQLIVDETQAGATIKLPASIDLAYDEAYGAFQYKEKIYCDGVIAAGTCIAVKCPERVTYVGANTNEELEAFVKFNDSNVGCFSQNDLENDIGRELLVQIPGTSVATADNFEATINFEISLAAEGMYTTHATALTTYGNAYDNNAYPMHVFTSTIYDSHITLNNLHVLNSRDKTYAAIYTPVIFSNDTVKFIEMSDNALIHYPAFFGNSSSGGNTYKDPKAKVTTLHSDPSIIVNEASLYSYNLRNPFMGFNNLAAVAIPSGISKDKLHSQLFWSGSGEPGTVSTFFGNGIYSKLSPYWEHNLTDKGIPIGDAILFVKGINENNSWIYIPNIAFRGTIAEWKALSANGEDWVFGNKANLVTVHCTDGKLYY